MRPRVQKYIFEALSAGLEIFQNNSHKSNQRSSDECMAIAMFKPAAQRQKWAFIFSTRKLLVLGVQRHLVM